jgi:hypothetical protein
LSTGRNVFLVGSLQLPEPLWELMRWGPHGAHPTQTQIEPDDSNVRAWVARVGWEKASRALVQLEVILECPAEILWSFRGIPWNPTEPYGWVAFFGEWANALCRALGLREQPLPSQSEWSGRGERRRALVAELRERLTQRPST